MKDFVKTHFLLYYNLLESPGRSDASECEKIIFPHRTHNHLFFLLAAVIKSFPLGRTNDVAWHFDPYSRSLLAQGSDVERTKEKNA